MSSGLGEVGVKCALRVEYCQGTSSPGSPLNHSLCLNACASSNAARLGVIPEVGSCVMNELGHCNKWYRILYFDSYFPNRVCKTFKFLHNPLKIQHLYILHANSYITHPISDQFVHFPLCGHKIILS